MERKTSSENRGTLDPTERKVFEPAFEGKFAKKELPEPSYDVEMSPRHREKDMIDPTINGSALKDEHQDKLKTRPPPLQIYLNAIPNETDYEAKDEFMLEEFLQVSRREPISSTISDKINSKAYRSIKDGSESVESSNSLQKNDSYHDNPDPSH